MIVLDELLELLDVAGAAQVLDDGRLEGQVRVVGLLVAGDDAQDVVHFELALLRLEAAVVRVRHVDEDQVGQEQAQVRHARQPVHNAEDTRSSTSLRTARYQKPSHLRVSMCWRSFSQLPLSEKRSASRSRCCSSFLGTAAHV